MPFLASIACLFLTLQICSSKHADKLIAAHVCVNLTYTIDDPQIHRHGDRNINSVYPNDPYKDDRYWPGGLGALTDLGKRQTFDLGRFLRWKYYDLIGGTYSDEKMYYHSTDRSRTIESAKFCAAGLYPWSHLPKIHVSTTEDDNLLYHRTKCAKFDKLLDKYLESRKVVGIWKKHRPLIKYMEKHSGKRIDSLASISKIYDTLHVEHLKGFSLPKWARTALKSRAQLEYLVGVYFEAYTHTTEMKKLKAGYLLDKILHHFKKKSHSQSERNLYIYSAHDMTIATVMNALNLYHKELPSYASSLHLELYKRGSDYYVQVLFRKSANDNHPPPLHIPRCGTMCPLDKFYGLYRRILPKKSFRSACEIR